MKHCYTVLGVILLLGVFPCFVAKDVCYSTTYDDYYCDDGYYCCKGNTQCCVSSRTSGSAVGIYVGASSAGVVVFIVVVVVCVKVCHRMNKPTTTVLPYHGQVINTFSTTQQQQPMYNYGVYQGNNTYPPPITTGANQSNSTHPPPITTGANQSSSTYPPPISNGPSDIKPPPYEQ